jgi:hypothetical protein
MKSISVLLPIVALGVACSTGDRESSAMCGITFLAGANRVLAQLPMIHAVLTDPPPEMTGVVPARVVGYSPARASVGDGPDGVVLDFEGEGFPELPGFGVALVDDSIEVFRGVLIFMVEPPEDYPEIGTVFGDSTNVPLYALRVNWSSVNSERCPIFSPVDTATSSR